MLWTASCFGACNLVLGIDDVSSANGPDAGQQISPSTAESRDASTGPGDASAGAGGRADAGGIELDASAGPRSPGLDASLRDRDASPLAPRRDAAVGVDEDAGADLDDAGLPR
jgi:hypothetical protein